MDGACSIRDDQPRANAQPYVNTECGEDAGGGADRRGDGRLLDPSGHYQVGSAEHHSGGERIGPAEILLADEKRSEPSREGGEHGPYCKLNQLIAPHYAEATLSVYRAL